MHKQNQMLHKIVVGDFLVHVLNHNQNHIAIQFRQAIRGADRKTLEEIIEIPFGYVVLHVADKYGYAHISVTDEYCKLLEFVI
mgnify:CR=1 FL=1